MKASVLELVSELENRGKLNLIPQFLLRFDILADVIQTT